MDLEQFGVTFEEEELDMSNKSLCNSTKVHIRIQQRNGKKSIYSISGLPQDLDFKKIIKILKKSLKCNGCVNDDDEVIGKVLQLQGDHRVALRDFLIDQKICTREDIVIHGI